MKEAWLIDKSAYVRLVSRPQLLDPWLDRINRGLVHVCTVTLLELGYSARNAPDWAAVTGSPPVANLMLEHFTPAVEDRALEVQGLLARRGQHRAPGIPDLLVAACGEVLGLTVLHLDKDFELIAEVTGQPVERLVDHSEGEQRPAAP